MAAENLSLAEYTSLYSAFMAPARRSAIRTLAPQPGSHGLDAGCGSGDAWPLLLGALGPAGRIAGIDIDDASLDRARARLAADELAGRVVVGHADLLRPLPFADGTFDWVWSSDVLWPELLGEDYATIRELARVTKSGGRIAIFFGNFNRGMLLPGYTFLEPRLYLASQLQHFGPVGHDQPRHSENARGWLRAAGLTGLAVSAHLCQHAAPLDRVARRYLETTFARLGGPSLKRYALEAGLGEEEWALWQRLSDPGSPDYLLDGEDYYCVRFGTLTTGRVPE